MSTKRENRIRRHRRIRGRVSGTAARPRLSVFVSNKNLFLQLIDDVTGKTMASVSSMEVKGKKSSEKTIAVAKLLADKASKLGVKTAVYDRGGNKYHGRVKQIAETVRENGIKI